MVPYLLVFMKKHGLTSEESGILVGVMPFLAFLAQPVVGMVADRWEKHKAILMAVTFTTGVSIVLITTVPARSRRDVIDGDVVMTCSPHLPLGLRHCVAGVPVADVSDMTVDDECRDAGFRSSESGNGTSLNTGCKIRGVVDKSENYYSCPPDIRNVLNAMQQDDNETLTSKVVCNVACPSQKRNGDTGRVCLTNNTLATSYSFHEGCEIAQYPNFPGTFDIRTLQKQHTDSPDTTFNGSLALSQNEREDCSEVFRVSSLTVDSRVFSAVHCESRREFRCQIRCHLPPGHACRANASTFDLTFWLIFVFYLVGFLALSPVIPMSDAVCYSLLGKEWRKYGHQRVWGDHRLAGCFRGDLGGRVRGRGSGLPVLVLLVRSSDGGLHRRRSFRPDSCRRPLRQHAQEHWQGPDGAEGMYVAREVLLKIIEMCCIDSLFAIYWSVLQTRFGGVSTVYRKKEKYKECVWSV